MRKKKLIRILTAFTASELRRLKDFVASPFFNKNEKIQSLFDFYVHFAPHFESEDLTVENAFKHVFPDEVFKEQTVTKLSSKLYKLIYTFINIEKGKEKQLTSDINFLTFLGERELIHEYEQHLNQVKKNIDKSDMRDGDFFYQQFLVEQEISKLQSLRADNGVGDVNYQPAVDALDKFYLLEKLNYFCQQYNRQQVTQQQNFSFELIDELESYIPNSPYFKIPTIRIWFTTLQLLKAEEKRAYYEELKLLVFKHHEKLNRIDVRNIFTHIQNNARVIFEKKEEYYSELFELYKFQLERKIFDTALNFTPQNFINIITIGMILNKLDWVAQFLEAHSDYSKNREDDVYSLGEAMLAFAQGKYTDAQGFLNDCIIKNIYFKLMERRLRLKVYLELQIFELIEDTVNSFRKFLSTNKESISDFHLQANRDFVNFTKSIFYLQKNDVEKIESLETEISSLQALPEKRWLLEKVEAFRKKNSPPTV